MTIIAHKGYSLKFSENSVKAFNEAIIECSDGIELDINSDSDNKYVIWHDRVSRNFIEKRNSQKDEEEQIIYFNDFCEYINSEKFKTLVKNNIIIRGKKFKIILDLKFSKKELKHFMTKYFQKYYLSVKKMDGIVTVVQSGIPNGFKDIETIQFRDRNKLRVSYLYHSYRNWYAYEWYKSYFLGIDMSLIDGADEIMFDYTNLNILNIFLIWIQLIVFKTMGLPSEINFFTVNNKYVAYLLQFIFSSSIVTDECKLLN